MTATSDLYGLPLERFVPERAVLAKALRAGGERQEAARVAKLAKPTAAAWVVNQLVRTQSEAVSRLFAAGDALKRAQADVVRGRGGGGALREASVAKRDALDALVAVARGLLDGQGHGPSEPTLVRVAATLDAAALQDEAREQVRDGCLIRELEHIGLGDGLESLLVAAPAPARPSVERTSPRRARQTASGREDERAARERERERARAAQERRDRAREAEARRRQAARELQRAQARRDKAARDADEARERLDAALRALDDAERALAQARERVELSP